MNTVIIWWFTTMAAMLGSSWAAVLPHKPISERVNLGQPHAATRRLTHPAGYDSTAGDQWASVISASRNFPLPDNDDDASPFQDSDRSIYDPGVVANAVHSSSAFLDALSESMLTDVDDDPADGRQQPPPPPPPGAGVAVPRTDDRATAGLANDDDDDDALLDNHENLLTTLRDEIKEDEDIAAKSAMLLKLLETTSNGDPMPIIYIEDVETPGDLTEELGQMPDKRNGRYYRRYPWKRQQSTTQRYRPYEPEHRVLCVPSRDDVFKLLVGLHDNRRGNQNRSINFCNRKRPAKVVFTSIRFLG